MPRSLTAVDLFSGAGGLTLGLKHAGFKVVVGVEIDSEIVKTYRANHPEISVLTSDLRKVTGKEILAVSGLSRIDLVAGCPPCQGFSKLTAKYRKNDPRNQLVLEMARIVEELKPSMVMMENVPGLAQRGKAVLDKFVVKLKSLGYVVSHEVLQLANYGVPQSRRRLVLLAGRGFSIELPKPTSCLGGDLKRGLKPWMTVREILSEPNRPVTLPQANRKGGPRKFNWHVVRELHEISKKRFRCIGPGVNRGRLPKSLRPKCHQKTNRGYENVYGRMSWSQIPPTITSGCTTPCMGRFGHPSQIRTISLREAATIQTFPKSYKFETDYMELSCHMVGNALPPNFAQKVGRACMNAWHSNRRGALR